MGRTSCVMEQEPSLAGAGGYRDGPVAQLHTHRALERLIKDGGLLAVCCRRLALRLGICKRRRFNQGPLNIQNPRTRVNSSARDRRTPELMCVGVR